MFFTNTWKQSFKLDSYPFCIHVHRKCNLYMFTYFRYFKSWKICQITLISNEMQREASFLLAQCTYKQQEKYDVITDHDTSSKSIVPNLCKKKIIIISYHFLSKLLYSYVSLDRCCL